METCVLPVYMRNVANRENNLKPDLCTQITNKTAFYAKCFFIGCVVGGATLSFVCVVKFAIILKVNPVNACIIPIIEEILFRYLLQDVIFTQIPKYVLKRIKPGSEVVLDSRSFKIAKIFLTATLFSAGHIQERRVHAFIGGVVYGILKESKYGLVSTIGGHIANNTIVEIVVKTMEIFIKFLESTAK